MLPETPITSIPRTGRKDVPYVALFEGRAMPVESFFCVTMAKRGEATFVTSLRPAMAELMSFPGWFFEEGRSILTCGDVTRSRDWIEQLVVRNGGRLKPIKGRPGFTVRVKKKRRRRVALLFIAMGAFVALMREKGLYSGPNPMLIDDWETLSLKEQAAVRRATPRKPGTEHQFRNDIGRFFRFPFELWIPIRTADVRWFVKLRGMVRAAGKYEAIELYVWIVGVSGCRPGEPQWLTFGAWWEPLLGFGHRIMLRNKGDDGDPEKEAFIIRELISMLERYVDLQRRVLDPLRRGMDYWRELGRRADEGCTEARATLDGTYVMLNSEGRRLTYPVVWYHVDTVFGDVKTNPVSLHWLRHEFVFTRMRQIERIADPALRQTERDKLCAYMGWASGELMLQCYDAYHRKHAVRLAFIGFGARREEAARKLLEPSEQDHDEVITMAPMLGLIARAIAA